MVFCYRRVTQTLVESEVLWQISQVKSLELGNGQSGGGGKVSYMIEKCVV